MYLISCSRKLNYATLHLFVCNVLLSLLTSGICSAGAVSDVIKQDDTLRIIEKDRQKALIDSIQKNPDVLKHSQEIIFENPVLGEDPCFEIKTISLIGQDSKQFNWLTKNLSAFTSHCLGVKSLGILQSNLNNRLLKEGYTTSRVSLPDQNLAQGDLMLQLNVGRIESFRVEDSKELDMFTMPWATWRNAIPISENDILNVRDLDQGLEQLQRLPSREVNIVIEPAETDNNSTLVIKREQQRRLRGFLSIDNSGSESIGREQVQLGLTLDDPLGLNDQLTFSASSNLQNATPSNRNQSAALYYSIPFGYSTFSTSFGYSRFGQLVQGTTVQFLSSGYTQNAEAKLHTIIMRDSNSKLGIYGALSTRRARSYLEDVELLVQQRRNTSAELGLTYSKILQHARLNIDTSYSVGLPWFQAEPRYLDSGFSDQPTTRPKIWYGSAEISLPLSLWGNELNYSSRLNWQTINEQALSIEQFSIGNRYSVRGFDENIILQSERGYSLRNDISLVGLNVFNNQLYLSPYVALDIGHLWGPNVKDSPYTSLAGMAIGVHAQTKYFFADIALGTPLYKPDNFDSKSINPMMQISLNL